MKLIQLLTTIFITFSFGSLPDSVGGPNDVGGLFVVGFYKEKPLITDKFRAQSIYLGMIEF